MKTKYIVTLLLIACVLLSFGVMSKKSVSTKDAAASNESGFVMADRNQF
jgi:hypothetical protein